MPHAGAVRDLLAHHASETFVGRKKELALLAQALDQSMPPVSFVHGIGGIGKSRVLEAFTTKARAREAFVVRLDCRQFEPTPPGFLRELGAAVGGDTASIQEACERLGRLSHRVVLILDNYEVLRLVDTWLRQEFVPAQPPNVHMILCGREAPLAAWLCSPGWAGLFRSIAIEPLAESEAIEFLAHSGISESRAHRINRFTRGHPLALALAAATLAQSDSPALEDLALHRVIEELARMYLDEISDEITRRALEAASVVRCATVSLFRAMLPDAVPQDAYERVRGIPFVQIQREGLQVHDCLQQAIALGLKAADPSRYLSYRRAAWRQLRKEVRTAPSSDLWRYTADMLYQLQNPLVREAFFPTGGHIFGVEPARPGDRNAVFDIARQWYGPESMSCLEFWWKHAPRSFHLVREPDAKLAGFYCLLDSESVTPEMEEVDPIVRNWMEHLKLSPIPAMQCALFYRGQLTRESGEGPCAVQGAFWLDLKRTYMLFRPRLRRVYATVTDAAFQIYAPVLGELGFQAISSADRMLDADLYRTAMLDFGPSSVDGWLGGLVAKELGSQGAQLLDVEARELVIEGQRVPLTPLEFSVMSYLHEHEDAAVSRESLLRDVWGHKYDVGSNVVDVVVRALRKKLGQHAVTIETVAGFGYRFRQTAGNYSP
jgi:hypothetical protein